MSPVQKMLYDLKLNAQKEGRKEGRQENAIEMTKSMLMCGESEEKIMKYTKISKKDLMK